MKPGEDAAMATATAATTCDGGGYSPPKMRSGSSPPLEDSAPFPPSLLDLGLVWINFFSSLVAAKRRNFFGYGLVPPKVVVCLNI
jgi:hypothetical protein